jgi:hypothetical protein
MIIDSDLLSKWITLDLDFRIANMNSGYLLMPPSPAVQTEAPTNQQQAELFEDSTLGR